MASLRVSPPAGLKAKDAVSVMLQYAREIDGLDLRPTKKDRGSFAAFVEYLDRTCGANYAMSMVNRIDAAPNGARSMYYAR
jgi:hypothetical protein